MHKKCPSCCSNKQLIESQQNQGTDSLLTAAGLNQGAFWLLWARRWFSSGRMFASGGLLWMKPELCPQHLRPHHTKSFYTGFQAWVKTQPSETRACWQGQHPAQAVCGYAGVHWGSLQPEKQIDRKMSIFISTTHSAFFWPGDSQHPGPCCSFAEVLVFRLQWFSLQDSPNALLKTKWLLRSGSNIWKHLTFMLACMWKK